MLDLELAMEVGRMVPVVVVEVISLVELILLQLVIQLEQLIMQTTEVQILIFGQEMEEVVQVLWV